ncbi:MAG: helix-turn-helix transcriptional regulator [Oscillospiraceae bacterium]|nr:helix-turn-helix transcriptional regulator [Oscillospiraceae bacterium]
MNTNRDLNYRLYLQREEGFTRMSFNSEFEKYRIISSGNVEKVKENFVQIKKNYHKGKGILSDDPVRNVRYHFIVAVALTSRICVESGMSHDVAYTLSDIYIQRADKCQSAETIIDMIGEMQVDYAERMREIKKKNAISRHIRRCIDYIYDHLHEKLTVEKTAEYLKLDPSYLSKLFAKETGTTFREFIINARVNAAKNMLVYSDFTCLEISLSLGFSSQSAFISTFRRATGQTPAKYRAEYSSEINV